jgi:2-methylcitrate dehydratase PrpD
MASNASGTSDPVTGNLMQGLCSYVAAAVDRPLPPEVVERAKFHTLDTIAAIVSGSRLHPGEMAIKFIGSQGGAPEATVIGSDIVTTATNAALANGMMAHADETDDSHKDSRSHLGCGVVPAALAMGEKYASSGDAMIRAVALGYDIGARTTYSLGVDALYDAGHSTHSFAPMFGAAVAAGALAGLSERQMRWLFSYTAQQASGVNCWRRDHEHIEKAFDFGGMPARNGVASAAMVAAGFTGVEDVFSGPRNFFVAFAQELDAEQMVAELGSRYEVMNASIKKWSVGSPAQAVLDSVESMMAEDKIGPADIESIVAKMSDQEASVVDNQAMPDINVQHLVSILLLDGYCSFASSHDYERMQDPTVLAMKEKIRIEGLKEIRKRQALVEIVTKDGRRLSRMTKAVRGTPDNRMTAEEVERKASDLMSPILGADRTKKCVEAFMNLEKLPDVATLRSLLTA